MNPISGTELLERLDKGEQLNMIDVRESIEYHTYNIGGINIPLARLTQNLEKVTDNKTAEIIVICKVGLRSQTASGLLAEHGYSNVRNLTGGLLAIQKLKK